MKTILIIEDEEGKNFLTINALKRQYKVEIAISVEAAINFLTFHKYDLIILDVIMSPGKYSLKETNDGINTGWILFNKELKKIGIPVIVWTRNDDIFTKDWGDKVLKIRKTYDESQLVDAVKKLFKD